MAMDQRAVNFAVVGTGHPEFRTRRRLNLIQRAERTPCLPRKPRHGQSRSSPAGHGLYARGIAGALDRVKVPGRAALQSRAHLHVFTLSPDAGG
jgi:hypothetical protein